MSDDPELDMILARKRRELLAMAARQGAGKAVEQPSAKKDPVEVLRAVLIDRGDEVLEAALSQYPEETRRIAERLAELVERGAIAGKITGRQLLWLFRQLGLDVRLETKIYVEQDGRFVPLMDAMKRKD
ncbi:MAG TPA: double-stranded DNA-binding protein [Nitrososphaeria archaeon]|jgi:DNA-binding TFAR19-related protein (PDSD5 family)|nr:DNA-binding protein [Conexivisphaerales archaeon]HEU16462.1 double-stranded DNA-binding protein [Nitrososphaeria archaeon]